MGAVSREQLVEPSGGVLKVGFEPIPYVNTSPKYVCYF